MPGPDRTPEILSRLDDHDNMQMKILAMLEDIGRKVDVAAKMQKTLESALSGLQSTVATHTHLLGILSEHQQDHAKLLADHARSLTDLATSMIAARETAREALKSGSDIKIQNDDFQKAVTAFMDASSVANGENMKKLEAELKTELGKVVESNTNQDERQVATDAKVNQILVIVKNAASALGHPVLRKVLIVVALLGTFAGAAFASYLGARQAQTTQPPPSSVLPTGK